MVPGAGIGCWVLGTGYVPSRRPNTRYPRPNTSSMKILLGVTGGIAAFRACDLVLLLRKAGHEIRVVMTEGAQQFVTPLTLETLSGNAVATHLWELPARHNVEHIELAQWPDRIAIAPATANVIGKIAAWIADDMLTTVVMASLPETP